MASFALASVSHAYKVFATRGLKGANRASALRGMRFTSTAAPAQETNFVHRLRMTVAPLAGTLNDLTGYSSIVRMKEKVFTADSEFELCKQSLEAAKQRYEVAIAKRNQLQKEMNGLLQRKSAWSDADMQHFTELYKKEHLTEAEEIDSQKLYRSATRALEKAQISLLSCIRERYIEEQNWSDKIRQTATWYTWALMLVHLGLFIAVQTYVEPRRRLAFTSQIETLVDSKFELAKTEVEAFIKEPRPGWVVPLTAENSPPPLSLKDQESRSWRQLLALPTRRTDYLYLALGSICGIVVSALMVAVKRILFRP